MATNIDTLATYETIAAAGIEDKGARAISKAIADSVSAQRADLATKTDLEALRTAAKADLDSLGLRLEGVIASTQNKTLIWMFGMLATFSGVILAGVKLL